MAEHRPYTTLSAILIAVFLMGAGSALQSTVIAVRGGIEGFSPGLMGIIMSVYYIGVGIGIFAAAPAVSSVGYVRSFTAFASIASASAIAHIIWINPLAWILFRLLHGICISVMVVVVESWLNASSTAEKRGRVLSVYSLVYLASMGIGQPIIALFSPSGYRIFGISTILISLCLVPLALAQVSGVPMVGKRRPAVISDFRRFPFASSGVVISGLLFGALWSLLPRFAQETGLGDREIGFVMFLLSAGTLAFQWPLGWLSDHRGRRHAMLFSSLASLCLALFTALGPSSSRLIYLLVFLLGGLSMPLYSLCIALINDSLGVEEMVQTAGSIVVYYGTGSALGPLLGGLCMGWWGAEGLFYATAGPLALFILFGWIRLRKIPVMLRKKKSAFRIYPRTSAAFSLLKKKKH